MSISQKAISPLIATVILLVVTVGIGAVVTSVARNFVSENKQTMDSKASEAMCARDVLIEAVSVDGMPQVCKGAGYVDFIIENRGGVAIDDFQLMVFGAAGLVKNDSLNNGTFAKGATGEINFTYSGAAGTLQEIRLVPKLKQPTGTGYFYCNEAALRFENVEDC